jgi:hypothetical protein
MTSGYASNIVLVCCLLIGGGTCSIGCDVAQEDFVLPMADQVISMGNPDVAGLTADDVVVVLRRVGFSDDRILKLGTDLRNELARTGAAKIRADNRIEALFVVSGNYLYVTSYLRGSFVYDCVEHKLR